MADYGVNESFKYFEKSVRLLKRSPINSVSYMHQHTHPFQYLLLKWWLFPLQKRLIRLSIETLSRLRNIFFSF